MLFSPTITLRAEPLAKEACEGLVVEQEKLTAGGVKSWLAQGPQGALARLGTDKLAQVERYIVLEEQIIFRCGLFKTRTVLAPDAEDVAPDSAQPSADAKPAGPASETPPAPAKGPGKAAATDGKKAASSAAAPQAKPKRQSPPTKKPKADDAFRPPTTD